MHQPLRIVHCFRAPVGGLFRHVCDLVRGQAECGHEIALICDSRTGGDIADSRLQELEEFCSLGITRLSMPRTIGLDDLWTTLHTRKIAAELKADILHGHGAKGGAYSRIAALVKSTLAFYTPHGGSLHYSRSSPAGLLFLTLEQVLRSITDGFIFESSYDETRRSN